MIFYHLRAVKRNKNNIYNTQVSRVTQLKKVCTQCEIKKRIVQTKYYSLKTIIFESQLSIKCVKREAKNVIR